MAKRVGAPVTHSHGFGAFEQPADWNRSKVCIVPVPYDSTTSFQSGARRGPEAIIAASKNLELFDSELMQDTSKCGIYTMGELEPNVNSPFENSQRVEAAVAQVLAAKKLPVILGGDHSITLGAVRAAKKKFPDIGMLVFDAHPDLMDEFEGSKFGHANVTRRVHELGVPVALAGVRSATRDELAYARQEKLVIVHPRDLIKNPEAIHRALSSLPRRIYLSIDIDVFDPGEMPATGTPEPGGLHWYDMMDILHRLVAEKEIVAFDVVELCPIPGNVAPDFLATKLIYRLIGLINAGQSAD
jgi:agmatinase